MCGIVAIHDLSRPIDVAQFQKQCRAMTHRGPDDEGYHFDAGVALGMRRLSIVDLEGGHQPIANEDESIWIVFNGEVYNQLELRHELEQRGHRFRTRTDTEVIVHLYEEIGDECVHRLNGMFAFALWDGRRRRLLVARDRLGIKPLYYTRRNGRITWASEIKVILEDPAQPRAVNRLGLMHYLSYLYTPAPMTLFEGISKLPPGHLMVCTDDGVDIRRYWDVSFEEHLDLDEQTAVDELQQHLERSIRRRLMADVPLGVYLSGGIDSSVIVALMTKMLDRPVKTFTLGFGEGNEEFNELVYAREVAERFGTDHHEFTVREQDIAEELREIAWYFDEPFGGGLHTYFLSKLAHPHVTVALTGLGSDELFGGYDRQKRLKMSTWYLKLPEFLRKDCIEQIMAGLPPSIRSARTCQRIERLIRRAYLSEPVNYASEIRLMNPQTRELISSQLLARDFASADLVAFLRNALRAQEISSPWNRLSYLEMKTTMVDDFLNYVDHMGMAHSMELRVPFLDHELVEFATRLPFDLKVRGFQTKYILKRMSARVLSNRITYRKKQPFFLPLGNWLRNDLREFVGAVLTEDKLTEQGYFDSKGVRTLLEEHMSGRADHGWSIWALLIFQVWHDRFIESADVAAHYSFRS